MKIRARVKRLDFAFDVLTRCPPPAMAATLAPTSGDLGEEFRSEAYWCGRRLPRSSAFSRGCRDSFFVKRGDRPFEWYSSWPQLRPLLREALGATDSSLLVVGCGNSELSAQLYDDGFENVTNVDFSKARRGGAAASAQPPSRVALARGGSPGHHRCASPTC